MYDPLLLSMSTIFLIYNCLVLVATLCPQVFTLVPPSILFPILGCFMHIHFYLYSISHDPQAAYTHHDIHDAHAHSIQHKQMVLHGLIAQ